MQIPVDSKSRQQGSVNRGTAILAMVLLLATGLSSPFAHTHDHDGQHSGEQSVFVHVHLPVFIDFHQEEDGVSMEAPEHGAHGRAIDMFVFDAPNAYYPVAESVPVWFQVQAAEQAAYLPPARTQSHDPPLKKSCPPRSPPIFST